MDRIALADHAFDKHSGIDPSHSVMRLCHVAQDALLRLAGFGVDRDHLAARVTLEDGEAQALPDLEGPPDQLVLSVRPVVRPVGLARKRRRSIGMASSSPSPLADAFPN